MSAPALRYVEPARLDALRRGDIVCVSDAPTGVALAPAALDRYRRFCRVLRAQRTHGRVVALTVDWYGTPRTVAGLRAGILGALVPVPPPPPETAA